MSSFILSATILSANGYETVIKHVNKTPNNVTTSVAKLSKYLAKPFKTDEEKYAAFYYWIAKNINYNKTMAKKPLFYTDKSELVNHVIKRKNGVCQHFSELFAALCAEEGLDAYVVGGYTKTDNKVDKLSHSWNIISIKNKRYFIDATWGGASLEILKDKEFPAKHFMLSPEENIKIRMPFDPIWQALSDPISYSEFDTGNYKLKKGNYNFNDKIKNYIQSDEYEQFEGKLKRMESLGKFNRLVRLEYEYTKENYQTLQENHQVNTFNQAGSYYNEGLKAYNEYANIKNNRSLYKKKRKSFLLNLLNKSKKNLETSEQYFSKIKPINADMRNQISKTKKVITEIKATLNKEIKNVNQKQ